MTSAEEDLVLEELRTHGGAISVGGSRCHTDYHFSNGSFVATAFDEGSTQDHPCSEEALRQAIRGDPDAFLILLRRPHLRALRTALAQGDRAEARDHLARARAILDPFRQGEVLDAVLADEPADPEVQALIRAKLADHTAWHVYMDLVAGWQTTEAVAAGARAYADRLAALVGEAPGLEGLRAKIAALAARAAAAPTAR